MLSRLFIAALWSPVGKGLTSWLLFVMFTCVMCITDRGMSKCVSNASDKNQCVHNKASFDTFRSWALVYRNSNRFQEVMLASKIEH